MRNPTSKDVEPEGTAQMDAHARSHDEQWLDQVLEDYAHHPLLCVRIAQNTAERPAATGQWFDSYRRARVLRF